MNINRKQYLTSFPSQNDKHIDFVIAYKPMQETPENMLCLNKRYEFFNGLKKENFEIFHIESSAASNRLCYALLHCKTERLLKEAEAIRLKMKLKNVRIVLLYFHS